MKQGLIGAATSVIVLVLVGLGIAFGGLVNVAADEPPGSFEAWFLGVVMDRSVASRSADLVVPALNEPAMLAEGASHYAAMCADCHGAPGVKPGEIAEGLHPRPPDFGTEVHEDAAEMFWVTKHGIKMTGMPAWGSSHPDEAIWNMVALLMKFPKMSPEGYAALVEASRKGHGHEGHAH